MRQIIQKELKGDNPFECGFDKYVNLDSDIDFLGKESLKKIRDSGVKKKLMGVKIDTTNLDLSNTDIFNNDNRVIGELRSAAYSPYFKKIVGIAMMKMEHCKIHGNIKMKIVNKSINGEICNLPII